MLHAVTLLWSALEALQSVNLLFDLVIVVPLIALILYVLMRFGLLAMVGMGFLSVSALGMPPSAAEARGYFFSTPMVDRG